MAKAFFLRAMLRFNIWKNSHDGIRHYATAWLAHARKIQGVGLL